MYLLTYCFSLKKRPGVETQPLYSFNYHARLFNEADSDTVLLRSLEWIDGVTEILSDDPVLVDAGGNDGLSDNLSSLLGEELVSLGGTSGLVSVTGNANLCVRVGLESLDNLIDLELLALTDVPLVDDEEDVA